MCPCEELARMLSAACGSAVCWKGQGHHSSAARNANVTSQSVERRRLPAMCRELFLLPELSLQCLNGLSAFHLDLLDTDLSTLGLLLHPKGLGRLCRLDHLGAHELRRASLFQLGGDGACHLNHLKSHIVTSFPQLPATSLLQTTMFRKSWRRRRGSNPQIQGLSLTEVNICEGSDVLRFLDGNASAGRVSGRTLQPLFVLPA